MKNFQIISVIIILFISTDFSYSQSNQFYISTFGALQNTDTRVVGYPEYLVEHYTNKNIELGIELSKHYGIELGLNIYNIKKISIAGGISFSYEYNKYFRPYNWIALLPEGTPHTLIGKCLDIYKYYLIGSMLNINYKLKTGKDLYFKTGIALNPYFRIKSYYRDVRTSKYDTYNKYLFFSFELNPYLGLRYKSLEFDFYYRVFQIKKVDRAIIEKNNTGYGGIESGYETFNPLKFGISIKYWFDIINRDKMNSINE